MVSVNMISLNVIIGRWQIQLLLIEHNGPSFFNPDLLVTTDDADSFIIQEALSWNQQTTITVGGTYKNIYHVSSAYVCVGGEGGGGVQSLLSQHDLF